MIPRLEEWCRAVDARVSAHIASYDRADARARTAGRVYSVRRHRKAIMLELAVGWSR